MFSLPAEGGILSPNMEGCSDERPIRLYGESVERFRIMLSVIYGMYVLASFPNSTQSLMSRTLLPHRPLQLQIYYTQDADVARLITIAEMTNKYHFTSTETWAVDALYNVVRGTYGALRSEYEPGYCPSASMKRLLQVALLCGHGALRDHVVHQWVDRIVARDLRPVHALEIADANCIRRLQGYAYYIQLLEMDDHFEPGVMEDGKHYSRSATTLAVAGPAGNGNSGNAALLPSSRAGTSVTLTPEQKERLLFGHWSLSRLWDRLRSSPPRFQQLEGCTKHQTGCLSAWAVVWRDLGTLEATLKRPASDVLGRLQVMERHLSCSMDMHAQLSRAMTPQCKRRAIETLQGTIKEVQGSLVDHFITPQTHIVQGATSNSIEGAS